MFEKIELQSGIEKYVTIPYNSSTIYIYNLDYTLYKTINIPAVPTSYNYFNILYISDNLFHPDDKIEYIFTGEDTSETFRIFRVFNEDGALILNADSSSFMYKFDDIEGGNAEFIFNTYNGTKMVLYNDNSNTIDFYNLPGILQCDLCEGSTTGKKTISEIKKAMLSNSYPNPSKDYTRIDYQLPKGINKGTIVIYDINGKETKRYEVDRTFNHLRISTTDMPSGTYFYNLQTEQGVSQGKKMIKIK